MEEVRGRDAEEREIQIVSFFQRSLCDAASASVCVSVYS